MPRRAPKDATRAGRMSGESRRHVERQQPRVTTYGREHIEHALLLWRGGGRFLASPRLSPLQRAYYTVAVEQVADRLLDCATMQSLLLAYYRRNEGRVRMLERVAAPEEGPELRPEIIEAAAFWRRLGQLLAARE